MKATIKLTRAKQRALLDAVRRETLQLVRQPGYFHLERWQRPEARIGKHVIRVDIREAWPNGRAYCSCGFDTGWIPLWDAEQRAAWHRLAGNQRAGA